MRSRHAHKCVKVFRKFSQPHVLDDSTFMGFLNSLIYGPDPAPG